MKRKHFLALSGLAPLGLLSVPAARGFPGDDTPVRVPLRKGTPADIKAHLAGKISDFPLSSLSSAEQLKAQRIADATNALLLKVLLNRKDPAAYPLSKDPDSLERRAASALAKVTVPDIKLLNKALADPARLKQGLGSLSGVDLKAELTPSKLNAPVGVMKKGIPDVEKVDTPLPKATTYNRLQLILRHLYCEDETNPEAAQDHMILGGLIVGASGNVKIVPSVFSGIFNDGACMDFGEHLLGTYSLSATSSYPKTFYAIFMLIESNRDDTEATLALTAALKAIATMAVTSFGGATVETLVQALVSTIGGLLAMFVDDDIFSPHAVSLTLSNLNQFGGAMSDYRRTGGIVGHGGRYSIGYQWKLVRA